jgi:hypothetical protein
MSQRHPLALVGGAATLLAALPLSTVFESYAWLVYSAIAVALVVGTAMGVRSLHGSLPAQVLAMAAALLLLLIWKFPSGEEFARLIPTGATFRHFGQLLADSSTRIRGESVPLPDFDGVLLLTIAGVGLAAITVDVLAVGLRRPAVAGLPMLAIYSVPVAVLPDGLSVLPFGFAAAGYLWLLVSDSVDRTRRFGRRFTGDGRDVEAWEPSPLASAGRRLAAVGIVIAIMLPLAVPGIGSGLIDRFGAGVVTRGDGGPIGGGPPGSTVDMLAGLTGRLTQRETIPMVSLATDDRAPHYLRLGIADEVADGRFTTRAPTGDVRVADGLTGIARPQRPGVTVQRHRARIEVVNLDMGLAPIYLEPIAIDGLDGAWFYDASSDQVFSRGANVNGRTYNLDYERLSYTPEALRSAGAIDPADDWLRRLSTVPPVQQVTALVARLTAGSTNQYDRVRAIDNHFGKGYTYATVAEPGTSGHAIVDFLAARRGFCVQYAMAMAWLVRAAGYPARVAVGFTRGAGADSGVTTLTNRNLHAWTEVFFPGFGWVPFDPTPVGAVVGSAPVAWESPRSDGPGGQGGETRPTRPVDAGRPGGPTGPQPPPPADGGFSWRELGEVSPWWFAAIAFAGLLLAVLLAPAASRRSRRRVRLAGGIAGEPTEAARTGAHAAWAEMLDTMVDFDVPVDEAETPRATGTRLSRLSGLDRVGDELTLLATAEERARYARTPLRPDGLGLAVLAIRRAMVERSTRRQRLVASLLPRSVTLRWRQAAAARVARAAGVTVRLRVVVAQASPRRLLTERAT